MAMVMMARVSMDKFESHVRECPGGETRKDSAGQTGGKANNNSFFLTLGSAKTGAICDSERAIKRKMERACSPILHSHRGRHLCPFVFLGSILIS